MQSRKRTAIDVFVALTIGASLPLMAQQPAPTNEVLEEVVVTGSQIRGAVISDALPISIVGSETIEVFGIDSGDQLLDLFLREARLGENLGRVLAERRGSRRRAGGRARERDRKGELTDLPEFGLIELDHHFPFDHLLRVQRLTQIEYRLDAAVVFVVELPPLIAGP